MTGGKMQHLLSAASVQGLRTAAAVATPDRWAMKIGMEVDGHAFTYDGRPYLKDIIRDNHQHRVIEKSAQMGATVISLTTALFWCAQRDWNVMYLMPVKSGTVPFSQGRIQPIIDSTAWLKTRFRTVDNINHKRTMKANFYVRGTNIVSELKEVPIDAQIWDERDEMRTKNLPLAKRRMDASHHKFLLQLSTPTVPGYGIDKEFRASDKRHWFIKCPGCNEAQTLNWEDNVKLGDHYLDCKIECIHCHRELKHNEIITASEENGHWVVTNEQRSEVHGYHLNQLFSPTIKIHELTEMWFKGQEDVDTLKELYNSALGLPFVVKGDRLTEDLLDECREFGYRMPGPWADYRGERVYVGVDVGKVLHVQGSRHDRNNRRQKLFAEIMSWGELHQLLESLSDFVCVIDANPETQKANELAQRFWGRVFVAHYVRIGELAQWFYPKHYGDIGKVRIDRTIGFDTNISQYMRKQVVLPADMRDKGEVRLSQGYNGWYAQMMSQVRVTQPDSRGNMVASYVQVEGADHWHHSDLYEMMAATFAAPPPEQMPQAGDVLTAEELELPIFEGITLDDGEDAGWLNDLGVE